GEYRFGPGADLEVTEELAGVEAVRVPDLGEQSSRADWIVGIRGRRPIEVEARRHDAPGDLRQTERRGLIEGLAIERQVSGQTHALVVPGGLRIPLIGKDQPVVGRKHGFQREPGRAPDLAGQLAADQVDDVGITALERRQPRGVVGNHTEDQPLHVRRLAPILVERLEYQLYAG